MSVQHVSLETRPGDVPAELRFWALLGFTRVDPPDEDLAARATWVQSGATQVHLLHADHPTVPPQGHVAVVCEAYEATVDALTDRGFEVQPRTPHWGAARCYVRSPGGHRVEVMAAPPG